MFLKKNVLYAASGGGHLTELLKSIVTDNAYEPNLLTNNNGHTGLSLRGIKHYFVIDPHKPYNVIYYIINMFQSLYIFLKVRPSFVVSTGAGLCLPIIFISKFFGSKIIFIEIGARVYTPSKTGQLVYKISDLFIIQFEPLQKFYPKAIMGRLI